MTQVQLPPLSACVTRILLLSGFPQSLKTRDIQQAFSDWDNVQGGFKIKWINDTSLYVVFADPTVAKRAYLQTLFSPPAAFHSATTGQVAKVRPYDGSDAQSVIQAVNTRNNNPTHTRGHSSRASVSVGGGIAGIQARMGGGNGHRSISASMSFDHGQQQQLQQHNHQISIPPPGAGNGLGREPSPTLPNLPTQPTLNSLISSSLSSSEQLSDASTTSGGPGDGNGNASSGPRIGNPGKRMLAHSLGRRHPNLARSASGEDLHARVRELQKGLHGISVTE